MSFFNKDTIYKYGNTSLFNLNILEFSKLYMPIISNNAIKIYMHMYSDIISIDSFKFSTKNMKSLLEVLSMNFDEFNDAKNNLEAIGLLQTYLNSNNEIFFYLTSPLNFCEFINNPKLKELLKKSIGDYQFFNLELIFNQNEIPTYFRNISMNMDDYYSKMLKNIPSFNFEKLYKNISETTSINIIFDKNIKEIINYNFVINKFSFEQIEGFIYKSIIKKDNKLVVSSNLLNDFFNQNDKNNIKLDFSNSLKVQRINDMFLDNCSLSSLHKAYKDYSNLTSEQYLYAITNTELSDSELDIIKNLRKKYNLNDKLINIMIDYAIDKTHHVLNEKYLSKIARSFNIKNISSLDDAYNHLKNWNNISSNKNKKTKKNYNNETKISQDINNINIIEESISEEEDLISLDW